MDIYTGYIPEWINDDDNKRLTASMRSDIISDSSKEGLAGISGRLSISIFEALLSKFENQKQLITQQDIQQFVTESKWFKDILPETFIEDLEKSYDYQTLQEVKSSSYFFNTEEIKDKVANYLFALNFEFGEVKTSPYTKQKVKITDEMLLEFEKDILEDDVSKIRLIQFRKEQQKTYIVQTLSQEMNMENQSLFNTEQFNNLFDKYTKKLRASSLKPLFGNSSFRRAINDFGTKEFESNDKNLKNVIVFMITNLTKNYKYDKKSSQEIILYLLDKNLQV
jgi:hypothetical protein